MKRPIYHMTRWHAAQSAKREFALRDRSPLHNNVDGIKVTEIAMGILSANTKALRPPQHQASISRSCAHRVSCKAVPQ